MNEEKNTIPSLTLDPNATQAAVQAAPVEDEVKKDVPIERPELDKLSPAEQAAVREFSEKIDVLNTEQVMNYGSSAQKNISEFSGRYGIGFCFVTNSNGDGEKVRDYNVGAVKTFGNAFDFVIISVCHAICDRIRCSENGSHYICVFSIVYSYRVHRTKKSCKGNCNRKSKGKDSEYSFCGCKRFYFL